MGPTRHHHTPLKSEEPIKAVQIGLDVVGIFVPQVALAIDPDNLGIDLVQAAFSNCPLAESLTAIAMFILSTATFGALSLAGFDKIGAASDAVVSAALDQLDYQC